LKRSVKRSILVLVVGLWASLSFISCGYNAKKGPPSGLCCRVLASQGVTATFSFGSLVLINGQFDVLPRVSPLGAGSSPGLMAITPTRNVVAAFDANSNSVFAVDTVKESAIGNIHLPGPTSSMVFPAADGIGYAAVPTATVNGFSFLGAVEVMNFSNGALTTIAVNNAQTVIANSTGPSTQLLVFSTDSDSVTVLSPGVAVPPVDTSCYTNPPNAVCTIVTNNSFSRPVSAIVSGSTAYVLSCGPQCGGRAFNSGSNPLTCGPDSTVVVQACVTVLDLGSLTITSTIPVDAATWGLLKGSTLYVAGTPTTTTNNDCSGQMWGTPPQPTAATVCGRLDIIDLSSGTVTGSIKITDGYHTRMDMTANGQLFIGSHDCTNIGNVTNPSGEVRGCLSIFKTADNSVIIPPDNGDVNGLQGFTRRSVEYVAEGGSLRVYDTTKDILLLNDFVPQGTINIVGYVGDVKAIDFF
jgi:hypothetical protein